MKYNIFEHSGEGIVGRHKRNNAKLFERIEHSGSRLGKNKKKKCKQTAAAASAK